MRITQEIDYAFRIVGHLAVHEGEVIGAPLIAEREKIPERFTLRILRKLNLAGITEAKRGAYGGYRLKKPKEDINLYDIILAVDGPIYINRCLADGEEFCSKNKRDELGHCKFHCKLAEIQFRIIKMFRDSTIDEFV
ncbi:MAG: Rrf2 family transcriptional regulator [Tissierellia bacterium]|nr:Rrf2 family transcriptional regulator [Tissierellia bacterium]